MTFTFLIERLDHSSSLSLTGDFDVFLVYVWYVYVIVFGWGGETS